MTEIELGRTYSDQITKFTGVCTGICMYLSGCHQALLTPPVKEGGDYVEGKWFDYQRLTLIANAEKIVLDNGNNPGFGEKPSRSY
jgi:hypothetical protein